MQLILFQFSPCWKDRVWLYSVCSSSGWSVLHRNSIAISCRVVSLAVIPLLDNSFFQQHFHRCHKGRWPCLRFWSVEHWLKTGQVQAISINGPFVGHSTPFFTLFLVEAPVPTWRLGLLAVWQSFVVLPPPLLMTTTTAAPDGALFASLSHSLSHRQGRHPQSVQLPYVVYYPICFSISNMHLSMRPVILAPYLHGGVPSLLFYGCRDVYVMLLLGQQRCMQVLLLL